MRLRGLITLFVSTVGATVCADASNIGCSIDAAGPPSSVLRVASSPDQIAKSDYETTSEHQSRLATSLGAWNNVSFAKRITEGHTQYSADTQILSMTWLDVEYALDMAFDDISHRRYLGAFLKVETQTLNILDDYGQPENNYTQHMLGFRARSAPRGETQTAVRVVLTPVVAKRDRNALWLVVSGSPLPKHSVAIISQLPAQPGHRHTVFWTGVLTLQPACAGIYDANTHMILTTFKLDRLTAP